MAAPKRYQPVTTRPSNLFITNAKEGDESANDAQGVVRVQDTALLHHVIFILPLPPPLDPSVYHFPGSLHVYAQLKEQLQSLCESFWPEKGCLRRQLCNTRFGNHLLSEKRRIRISEGHGRPDFHIEYLTMGSENNYNFGIASPFEEKSSAHVWEHKKFIVRLPVNKNLPRFDEELAIRRAASPNPSTRALGSTKAVFKASSSRSNTLGRP